MAQLVSYTCKPCLMCGKSSVKLLDAARFAAWQGGVYVQDAFPEMSADEREVLVTGIHADCWNKLFPEDDEELVAEGKALYEGGLI
jgi:hypothetical protein